MTWDGRLRKDAPLVMGIVNLTPDSFSDGGQADSGFARAAALLEAGADLIDFGGESTRPGSTPVDLDEELRRVMPVLERFCKAFPHAAVSVDTRHGAVAAAALETGACLVNDVGMGRDKRLLAEVARRRAFLVLCHSRGTPRDMGDQCWQDYGADVVSAVKLELRQAAAEAAAAGVDPGRIWFDPGCGFAKNAEQDWELIARAAEFRELGPVLFGVSRKSFIGAVCGEVRPECRGAGTLAAELSLAASGVEMIRTHDVKALTDALKVRKRIMETTR